MKGIKLRLNVYTFIQLVSLLPFLPSKPFNEILNKYNKVVKTSMCLVIPQS